jgi:hypothetical protein
MVIVGSGVHSALHQETITNREFSHRCWSSSTSSRVDVATQLSTRALIDEIGHGVIVADVELDTRPNFLGDGYVGRTAARVSVDRSVWSSRSAIVG